MKMSNTLLGL